MSRDLGTLRGRGWRAVKWSAHPPSVRFRHGSGVGAPGRGNGSSDAWSPHQSSALVRGNRSDCRPCTTTWGGWQRHFPRALSVKVEVSTVWCQKRQLEQVSDIGQSLARPGPHHPAGDSRGHAQHNHEDHVGGVSHRRGPVSIRMRYRNERQGNNLGA